MHFLMERYLMHYLMTLSDNLLCIIAISTIRLYQLVGRRLVYRECLFQPSCSQRALELFRNGGFLKAYAGTRQQLCRCNGNYSLQFIDDTVTMITIDGEMIPEQDPSGRIVTRMKYCTAISNMGCHASTDTI